MRKSLALCFYLMVVFTTTAQDCRTMIDQSNALYDQKKFTSALSVFQSALTGKCQLNEVQYYNGACIASLANQPKLALEYLRISISKGYEDTSHMASDTDLDNIRKSNGYKSLINGIKQKYAAMKMELAKLPVDDFDQLIPYSIGEKWGWLNRSTRKIVTKTIFDYTDFNSGAGLYFVFSGKQYLYTLNKKVVEAQGFLEEVGLVSLMDDAAPEISGSVAGFESSGWKVSRHSDRFANVNIARIRNIMEPLAIATDKSGRKGIIRADGKVVSPFDFQFEEIEHFGSTLATAVFIAKRPGQSTFEIFDINGKLLPVNGVTAYDIPYNYAQNPRNQGVYIGYGDVFTITSIKGKNVFNTASKTLLFPRFYKNIIFINGPTNDINRTGSPANAGLKERFFLVSDGQRKFYVDGSGREYIPQSPGK